MFPMVYHRFKERSHIQLFGSSDGIVWNEVPGGPVLQPGETETWDREFLGSGKDLMPFGPDRIATPYTGTRYPHKYPRWPAVWDAMNMGWASWQKGRIGAVVADGEGEFWTQPVVPAGGRIRLNYGTPMAGEIRVGIESVQGRSAEDCDPLTGDEMARQVTWGGEANPRIPEGETVVLHIRMRRARLFSVSFTP